MANIQNFAYLGPQPLSPLLITQLYDWNGPIGCDVETVSLEDTRPIGVSFATNPGEGFYFPIDSPLLPWHKLQNPSIPIIFHNFGFDVPVLEGYHSGLTVTNILDSCIAAKLLGLPAKLSELCLVLFNRPIRPITDLIGEGKEQITMDMVPEELVAERAIHDARDCLEAWEYLKDKVPPKALDLEIRLMPVALDMQARGIRIDKQRVSEHRQRLEKEFNYLKTICEGIWGFNPGSSMQLAASLEADGYKIPYKRGVDGKRRPNLNKEKLETYYLSVPKAVLTLKYRRTQSLLTNLIRPLDQGRYLTGDRIHPRVNLDIAETGRISRSKPATQNITRELRDIIIPGDGLELLDWDFCLSEGTLVDTPYGDIPIEKLDPNSIVFSWAKGKPKAARIKTKVFQGVKECLKITLDNGKSFTCTPNHKVPIVEGFGYNLIEAKELKAGSRLLPLRRSYAGQDRTTLYSSKAIHYVYEHQTIAELTLGPRPPKHEIDHINYNYKDNRPENLRYLPISVHRSKDAVISYALQDHKYRLERLREGIKARRSYVGEGNPNYGKRKGQTQQCAFCNKDFYKYPSLKAIYCGKACSNLAQIVYGLNHKVVLVENVGKVPVWDIEVDSESHLFALSCGVYTSNSQIELRWAAYRWEDKAMQAVFKNPPTTPAGDVHQSTADLLIAQGLGSTLGPTPELRRWTAKQTNFTVLFDGDEWVLWERYQIPTSIGAKLVPAFWKAYPGLAEGVRKSREFALKNGYTETHYGRRRDESDRLNSGNAYTRTKALRELVNNEIQGSAAETLKEAMWVSKNEPQIHTVHDQVILEVPPGYQYLGHLSKVAPFETPIEIKRGPNWGAVK